jgi:hypothetical protein
MGIRFSCPQGHKLHVKTFLAGMRGICPTCGAKFVIPAVEDTANPTLESPAVDMGPPSVMIPVVQSLADDDSLTARAPVEAKMRPPRIATERSPMRLTIADQALQRRRNQRRMQLTAAIVLLVAVIVLALVLAWVLQRGAGGGSPTTALGTSVPATMQLRGRQR